MLSVAIDFLERSLHTFGVVSCSTSYSEQEKVLKPPWLQVRIVQLHNLTPLSFLIVILVPIKNVGVTKGGESDDKVR